MTFSDDGGKTWQLGATQFGGNATHFANEEQAVQLRNGDILVSARTLFTHRLQAISTDEGLTFGDARVVPELREPLDGCEGSLVINRRKDVLLYSGPNSAGLYRENMTVWISPNADGASWEVLHHVDPSPAGYSSMAFEAGAANQSHVSVLWEQSNETRVIMLPDRIIFQTLPVPSSDWPR
jgi:sialidase-1